MFKAPQQPTGGAEVETHLACSYAVVNLSTRLVAPGLHIDKCIGGAPSRPKVIGFDLTRVGFTIWDSGPGVDPRFEDSLFEMFVTSKPKQDGQGLGLFIIRQLLLNDGCDVVLTKDRNADGRRYKFAVNLSPYLKE